MGDDHPSISIVDDDPEFRDSVERLLRSVGLHARQYVAVEIERDRDTGMAESFLGDLGMHARGQQLRGVAVPQIV